MKCILKTPCKTPDHESVLIIIKLLFMMHNKKVLKTK